MSNKKYILKSGQKTAKLTRILAKAIDLFISILVSLLFYPFGIVIAVAYFVFSDYIQEGQSVGKRFMGFKVVSLKDGKPCSIKQSALRNLPFIIPLIFSLIPLWGWFISLVLSVLILVELYFIIKIDSGHRLGDVMADTTVIADDPTREDLQKKAQDWFSSKKMSPCNKTRC